MSGEERRLMRGDYAIAAFIALLVAATLLISGRRQGFTRDEGYYFRAAEQHYSYYAEAARGLISGRPLKFAERKVIDRWLSYNSEHPPLMKTLFGLSWNLLHTRLGLLKRSEAMRLPTGLLAGLLCAAIYLFSALLYSRAAGLLAAGLTIFAPRHFFHAQLACFDAPITALIGLTTLSYFMAQRRGTRGWLAATGILAGLALSTKHNAFFLPFALLLHSLFARRHLLAGLRGAARLSAKARLLLRYVFAPWVLAMALLAIPVYLLSWPWLWHDTLRRFASYVGFHLHHVYYNIEYLGQNYNRPPFPWHYVPVVTLLTTPLVTLVLAAIGVALLCARKTCTAREDAGAPALLLIIGLVWPMALIARPGTPIFGAEKHWLPSFPFLALLGGAGLHLLCERLSSAFRLPARGRGVLQAGLCLLCLLPPALEVRRSHPYALSHYNVLAGGPEGGADLGMNRQFWGYAVRGVFPWLNEHAPRSSAVYFHDANHYMLETSMAEGLLRRDLRDSGMEEEGVRASDLALVIHEKHFNKYEYWIWDAYRTTRPVAVLDHEGVPIVTLYRRR